MTQPEPGTPEDPQKMPWNRRIHNTALILCKNGDVALESVKPDKSTVPSPGGGVHVIEAHGKHWLPRPIPAGWLHVYGQDDPEPFTTRKPTGYDKKTIEMMTGKYTLHLVGGGLKGYKEWKLNPRIVLVVLVVLGCIAAGLWLYRQRFGG